MQTDLTPKQQQLLDYLRRALMDSGRVPSLREIAADLGVSHSAVGQLFKSLESKGLVRREGKYSRTVHLLNPAGEALAQHRWRELPIVGRVAAGVPMYAQQEWDGTVVVDAKVYTGRNLFALRVRGESMRDAGILDGDLAICRP
ncbi:MAG: LexA family protein, partial [Desulfococcaceae bacterium]